MKPKGARRKMQRLMGTVLSLGDLLIDPARARRRQQVEQWREWDENHPSPHRSPAALRFSVHDTLMSAVIENDIASVSSTLRNQPHVDLTRVRTGNHGLSLLHQCAARNLVEMASLMLAHGMDLETTDALGWTALHTAAAYGQREMVVVLLSKGADVLASSYDGRVACEVVCSVSGEVGGKAALALKDDITEVLWAHMRERGVDSAAKLAEHKQTPENDLVVHIKAIAATHRIVKGQNPAIQPEDCIGHSPPISPHPEEQWDEVDENTPADEPQIEIHPPDQTDIPPDSSSPETDAPPDGGSSCECPPPDSNRPISPDGYEDACAHCSTRRQSLSVALQAAEAPSGGAPPIPRTVSFAVAGDGGQEVWEIDGEVGDTGVTMLHMCAHRGWRRAGEVLLKLGADPNSRDADGWTPLHVAVYHNRPEFVRLLACNGADTSLLTADTQETIQDIAGGGGSTRQGMKERRIRLLRYTRASQAEFSKGF